jgi:hypothetical protein
LPQGSAAIFKGRITQTLLCLDPRRCQHEDAKN